MLNPSSRQGELSRNKNQDDKNIPANVFTNPEIHASTSEIVPTGRWSSESVTTRSTIASAIRPNNSFKREKTTNLRETLAEWRGRLEEKFITSFALQIRPITRQFYLILRCHLAVTAYKPRVNELRQFSSVLASWRQPVIAWFTIIGAKEP